MNMDILRICPNKFSTFKLIPNPVLEEAMVKFPYR